MLGQLARHIDRQERLEYKIGPKDMQYLQRYHHKDHKPIRKDQHLLLKIIQMVPRHVTVHRRHNTHRHKQHYPATYPTHQRMHVYQIQHHLRIVLVILPYLYPYLISPRYDQPEITVVMNQQHKHTNQPLISQIAKHDQKYR